MGYLLTTLELVQQVSGIEAGELSDEEVEQYIADATDDIYDNYGRPISKTTSTIEADEYEYDLDRYKKKIKSIEYVEIGGSEFPSGSWTAGINEGTIILGSTTGDDNVGERLEVEWIPRMFGQLATFMAADKCLQAIYIVSGEEVTNPRVLYIQNQIQEIGSRLLNKVPGVFMSSKAEGADPRRGNAIVQDFSNLF